MEQVICEFLEACVQYTCIRQGYFSGAGAIQMKDMGKIDQNITLLISP